LEITKELKEKLLSAKSAEDVKTILGQDTSEKEVFELWQEIEAHKAVPDLQEVDDDELEAVAGGADRNWATQGCISTASSDKKCSSYDYCSFWDTTYEHYLPCVDGKYSHDWDQPYNVMVEHGVYQKYHSCKKCGKMDTC